MRPRRLFCLALLAALRAQAGEGLKLEAVPAWGGAFQPGRPTEIEVRVRSPQGGRAELEIRQADLRLALELAVEAGVPKSFRLPLTPPGDAPLTARLALAGLPPVEREIRLSRAEGRALAVVDAPTLTEALAAGPDGPRPLATSAAALPGTVQGYGPVDGLALDFNALGRLDPGQAAALYHYLAQCGRLLALDFPEPAARALRQNAGCGGRFLKQAGAGEAPAAARALLLQAPPRQLAAPPPAEDGNPALRPLLGLALAYFILLPAAARLGPKPLLALPPFAAGLALLAWGSQAPALNLEAWLETASGQGSIRYAAALRADGLGRWGGGLRLPAEAAFAAKTGDWRLEPGGGQATAREPFFLLSAEDWRWQGSLALPAPLRLEETADGLKVANAGPEPLPPGWVGWRGAAYALPALAPGEAWSPGPAARVPAPQDPLARRLEKEGTAALIPFLPDALKRDAGPGKGWLLVREAGG